jgi:hypothetical protein
MRERGQASVELVVLLPLIVALAAGVWQLVLMGQTASLAGSAARAGARAAAAGGDPVSAARSALPRGWSQRVQLRRSADGPLVVRLEVPSVTGGLLRLHAAATVGPSGAR